MSSEKAVFVMMIPRRLAYAIAMACLAGCCLSAWGQEARPPGGEASARPGIRFTPGMARALGRIYAEDVAVQRYSLAPEHVDELSEQVARRFMTLAHQLDGQGYHEVFETMITRMIEAEIEDDSLGGPPGIKPKTGRALGEALAPIMPQLREAFNGIGQDVRPKLEMRQQLKLGADLMALNTALDAFEKTMERWSRGEVRPSEDPFSDDQDLKPDAEGRSQAYNNARQAAERDVDHGAWAGWARYVEDAKQFYALDESQASTADSILRECMERVETVTKPGDWRERVMRNRVWFNMLDQLNVGPAHPLRHRVEREFARMADPIETLEADLKRRIDGIPTQIQRAAAEKRLLGMLADRGFEPANGEPETTQTAPQDDEADAEIEDFENAR